MGCLKNKQTYQLKQEMKSQCLIYSTLGLDKSFAHMH